MTKMTIVVKPSYHGFASVKKKKKAQHICPISAQQGQICFWKKYKEKTYHPLPNQKNIKDQ